MYHVWNPIIFWVIRRSLTDKFMAVTYSRLISEDMRIKASRIMKNDAALPHPIKVTETACFGGPTLSGMKIHLLCLELLGWTPDHRLPMTQFRT